MGKILLSILGILSISSAAFFSFPLKKRSDFVLFKKEASFKFDGNQAIDQGREVLNNFLNQPAQENFLENKEKIVEAIREVQVAHQNLQHVQYFADLNLWLLAGFVVSSCLVFFLAYKYYHLQKKFNAVLKLYPTFIINARKLLVWCSSQKSTFVENRRITSNLIEHLKISTINLKNGEGSQVNKPAILNAIKLSQRNLIKKQIADLDKRGVKTLSLLKEFHKKNASAGLISLHTKYIRNQNFEEYMKKPAFFIYAALSFVVLYNLVEMGMMSPSIDGFVENLNQRLFIDSSFNTAFSPHEISNISPGATGIKNNIHIDTTLGRSDKTYNRFHDETAKKITDIFNKM